MHHLICGLLTFAVWPSNNLRGESTGPPDLKAEGKPWRYRYFYRKTAKLFANSGDPDQTPHSAVSDHLGLPCLQITCLGVSRLQWVFRSRIGWVWGWDRCYTRIGFSKIFKQFKEWIDNQNKFHLLKRCLRVLMRVLNNPLKPKIISHNFIKV